MCNDIGKIENRLFDLQVKLIETKRQLILTLCIICGATASFSAALLNSQAVHNRAYLLCSIALLLFAIGSGIILLKRDIESDINGLKKLTELLNESDSERLKKFFAEEEDKGLDYTLDFMVYPFIGSLVAIFLSFLKL